ncbi:hypothetical protein [Aquimarina algiphila]|uniref:hypothetical protein n=1 Tax=Aquimarina algiphila TaxID=2047982 RepID=UPI00232EC54C|nr:hypothetical protein [Aquimarina algiphila]
MIFGTVFTGQIKSQNKQCIETKVFCFIVPIYVMTTTLVTDMLPRGRKGVEIKTNKTSIIAAFIRPIISVLTFFSIGAYIGNFENNEWQWLIIPSLISISLFVYFWFYFGKTTKKEAFIRNQFAKETGLYFIPNWMKNMNLKHFFAELKKKYKQEFNDESWNDKLIGLSKYDSNFSLFFCLTALEAELNNDLKKKDLIDKTTKTFAHKL